MRGKSLALSVGTERTRGRCTPHKHTLTCNYTNTHTHTHTRDTTASQWTGFICATRLLRALAHKRGTSHEASASCACGAGGGGAAGHGGHSREHTTPWLINGDDTTVPPDIGPAADIDIGPEAGPE